MSATYNPSLPADLDWVRYLTGDTVTASAHVSNEEITAVLSEESTNGATGTSLKYFAAARVLSAAITRYGLTATNNGVTEKIVDDLEIKWGTGTTTVGALAAQAAELRARGAFLLASKTKVLVAS